MSLIKKLIIATLLSALVVGSLVSCAGPAATPTPAPAPAGPEYEWRLQSLYHPGLAYNILSQGLADRIELMSGGRVKISVFTGGALCPAKEIHTAVGKGQFEMATDCGAYLAGVMPEGYIEFALPGGPRNMEEYHMFVFHFGFYEILEEAYNELDIHYITPNAAGWRNIISTKPIHSVADLKGLKIRATGIDAKWLEKLGASPTFLPVTEIYTGLAMGTIDANLYGGPTHHWDLKLMEVAKYSILPSVEVSCSNTIINLELWNSLPDDIKSIIETAAFYQSYMYSLANEVDAREKIERMESEYGVEFITLPRAEIEKMRAAGMEALREAGGDSARYARAMEILDAAMEYYLWRYAGNY